MRLKTVREKVEKKIFPDREKVGEKYFSLSGKKSKIFEIFPRREKVEKTPTFSQGRKKYIIT